jgi:xanthine dehydrogenase YagS FAD-binding subunit
MSAPVLRRNGTPTASGRWIAGGTTLVDLMKLGIETPSELVDLGPRKEALSAIEETAEGATLGALATMAEAERHPLIRSGYPAIHLALAMAASPQIREMATLGDNILQRTRCTWFRDGRSPCNKRRPGSGCSGVGGDEAMAILGASEHCMATYAGDFAVALVMLDAELTVETSSGTTRRLPVSALHRLPAATPAIETTLDPGDLIVAIHVPPPNWTGETYVKLRDRASYAFASASAAVALRLEGPIVAEARVALGGLATVPWRCRATEAWLVGRALSVATALEAGRACLTDAVCGAGQDHRAQLGIRAVAKALLDAAHVGQRDTE